MTPDAVCAKLMTLGHTCAVELAGWQEAAVTCITYEDAFAAIEALLDVGHDARARLDRREKER